LTENVKTVLVIIPCYNRPKPLEICLNSLNLQTSKDFEVIVVDDCSEKSLSLKIKLISEKFSTFTRYISAEKRLGLPGARNLGLKKIQNHQLILFLDDDCRTEATLIHDLIDIHNLTFDKTIKVFVPRLIPARDIYLHTDHNIAQIGRLSRDVYCNFNTTNQDGTKVLFGHACSCFRAEVFENLQFDPLAYTMNFIREETDLFMRIRQNGWFAIFCPSIIIYHDNFYPNSGCKISIVRNEIATIKNQVIFVGRFFKMSAFLAMQFFILVRLLKIISFTIPVLAPTSRKVLSLLKL
jgi:GT2 family glycosyltransferase